MRKLIFLFVLMSACSARAQAPDSIWTRVFGDAGTEQASGVAVANDGDVIIVGYTDSFGAGGEDFYVVRLDGNGNEVWSRTYGSWNNERASGIVSAGDGGFVIAGQTNSIGSGCEDLWLLKIDGNGDSLWSHTYGTGNCENAHHVLRASDGGYVVAAGVWPGQNGGWDYTLLKTDENGLEEWRRIYGGFFDENAWGVAEASDGGFVFCGEGQPIDAAADITLIKVDANGDSVWSRAYGTTDHDGGRAITALGDGSLFAIGFSWGYSWLDFVQMKLEQDGDTTWMRTSFADPYTAPYEGIETVDGGLLTVGDTRIYPQDTDNIFVTKLTTGGLTEWTADYGSNDWDGARAVVQLPDSSLIVAGYTQQNGSQDMYVVKIGAPCVPVVTSITLNFDTLTMFPTWDFTLLTSATTTCGPISVPASEPQWLSSNPAIVSFDVNGQMTAQAAGTVTVTAIHEGYFAECVVNVQAPALPPVWETPSPYLSTPAENAVFEIPVLIMRFLPTADGENLDVSWAADFWGLGEITLDDMIANIDNMDWRVKYMLEEGSKFRGFSNATARPSIGYRVVDYITVYEPPPPGVIKGGDQGYPLYHKDHFAIAERFDWEYYVNTLGVREIWIWEGGVGAGWPSYDPQIHTPERFRGGWESNMSSPTTGDISNSDRDNNDLPMYDHTYIVYGQNIRRSQAEAAHNHGHQLESMLSHANWLQDGNSELFWWQFCGGNQNGFVQGRCGNTHFPPNGASDYDYLNESLVWSDIFQWQPSGGPQTLVNVDTWGQHPYEWLGVPWEEIPQREESQWYMMWMQSMPGWGNTIPYANGPLTNWWTFTARWDDAVNAAMGLHGPQIAYVPSALTIMPSGNDIVLRWNANGNSAGTTYVIERAATSDGVYAQIGTTTNTSYTDGNPVSATGFYRVRAGM